MLLDVDSPMTARPGDALLAVAALVLVASCSPVALVLSNARKNCHPTAAAFDMEERSAMQARLRAKR